MVFSFAFTIKVKSPNVFSKNFSVMVRVANFSTLSMFGKLRRRVLVFSLPFRV